MNPENLHPGLSIDCVIFGFHDNQLKVLLLKFKNLENWALPGGFIQKNENLDQAAVHILQERTGLDKIFLTQFQAFGDVNRTPEDHWDRVEESKVLEGEALDWFKRRFVTIGYYSLVEFSNVVPKPDEISEECTWHSINDIPELIVDHKQIIERALWTLRTQLKYYPIGKNLLPNKFTMPELQSLYETLLDVKLDRRNFQRKMIGYDILIKHKERRQGGAHKAPFLYSFDEGKYERALENGLMTIW